jgi:hypothetical protein
MLRRRYSTRQSAEARRIAKENEPSPTTKKLQKYASNMIQLKAFDELMQLRAGNGNKAVYGDIKSIVERYKSRGYKVERHHLEYRMQMYTKQLVTMNNNPPITEIYTDVETTISPLTPIDLNFDNNSLDESNDSTHCTTNKRTSVGGRKKGSSSESKVEFNNRVSKAMLEVTTLIMEEKNKQKEIKQKLRNGYIKETIEQIEQKYNLPNSTINRETVLSRIKSGNVTGFIPQRCSPLIEVEPLIVDWICRMSRMGEAFSKQEIIQLADDIIRDTKYAENYIKFLKARGINKNKKDETIVGEKWYQLFIKRHNNALRRGKCRITDCKRRTWCTYEHFDNMYNCIYESMVECGVAIKLDSEKMFDKSGNITEDVSEMYGRPSKYQLIHPERCLFVDETGCNTNQKNDGYQGGKMYIVDKTQDNGSRIGTIHFRYWRSCIMWNYFKIREENRGYFCNDASWY